MSELEQDFDKMVEKINAKIKEAAAVLDEANELAFQAGLPSLIYTQFTRDDMQFENRRSENPLSKEELQDKCDALQSKLEVIDVGPLEAAMGDSGWSASSSYC